MVGADDLFTSWCQPHPKIPAEVTTLLRTTAPPTTLPPTNFATHNIATHDIATNNIATNNTATNNTATNNATDNTATNNTATNDFAATQLANRAWRGCTSSMNSFDGESQWFPNVTVCFCPFVVLNAGSLANKQTLVDDALIIGGLGPVGLDCWDPLWKGLLLNRNSKIPNHQAKPPISH